MSNEPLDVRSELAAILSDEFNAAGIVNHLIPESWLGEPGRAEAVLMPAQIVVPLHANASGRAPEALVYFLPVFEDPPVVQYMVFLDHTIEESAASNLARFIALVNSNLTITGFEMSEAVRRVVFRHTHSIGTQPLDPGVIAWPLEVIRQTIDRYDALIGFVAAGGGFDDAVALLSNVS